MTNTLLLTLTASRLPAWLENAGYTEARASTLSLWIVAGAGMLATLLCARFMVAGRPMRIGQAPGTKREARATFQGVREVLE